MAKRKLGHGTESSAKNIPKSARKFHIPALLKTEQIEVEVKPEIDTPCTDSKSSITSNNILRVHLGEIFVECPLSSPYLVVGHTKGTSNMQF